MMTIIILASLSAATAGYLIHPLMTDTDPVNRKKGILIAALIASLSLGLYLWHGSPDSPSAPALFEKNNSRTAQRSLGSEELIIMKQLAKNPSDKNAQTDLGEIYYAKGLAVLVQKSDIDRALTYLNNALQVAPIDAPYREQLQKDLEKINKRD